ncbi:MAG: hypothetical protein AB7H92_12675 [Microbacteriaceae bacterium]
MTAPVWFPPVQLDHTEQVRPHLGASPSFGAKKLDGPQAFLVRRPASMGRLRVHWHAVAQFQYFTDGAARVGGHRVERGDVHFADALTPYGPLDPAEDGVAFLTLRQVDDQGAFYMPDAQAALRDERAARAATLPRRNLTFALRSAGAGVLAADDDGMGVEVVDLAHGATAVVEPGGAGAYVVVVDGSLAEGDEPLVANSFGYIADAACVRAGRHGARVGVLRFPRHTAG